MKNIYMFFYSMSIISFQLHSAAMPAPSEKWLTCVKAIQEGDVNAFGQSFSKDLLPMHSVISCNQNIFPVALVHVAALYKTPNAAKIMETLLSEGQDPDKTESFRYQRIIVSEVNGRVELQGATGFKRTLTPLDIAVLVGNVPVVKTLLQHDADPYNTARLQTSLLEACVKMFLCKRVGEDPLTHACAYLEHVKEARRNELPTAALFGTEEEYTEIITLLEEAQTRTDLEDVGKCPCAIS